MKIRAIILRCVLFFNAVPAIFCQNSNIDVKDIPSHVTINAVNGK